MIEFPDFENHYKQYRSQLTSFIYRMTTSDEDTKDLVQDTFEAALSGFKNFSGQSSFKTWVFSIAYHKTIDFLRKHKKWRADILEESKDRALKDPAFLASMKQISEEPNGKFEIREHINFCFTCISKTLPIEQQVCILLREVYAFPIKEIACIVDRSESVVKHALERGRKKLVDIFDKKCSLISKKGTCHQCSEMNTFYNPKSNTQQELMKIKLVREAEDHGKQKLFELRTALVSSIDPLETEGFKFQRNHMKHARKVAGSI